LYEKFNHCDWKDSEAAKSEKDVKPGQTVTNQTCNSPRTSIVREEDEAFVSEYASGPATVVIEKSNTTQALKAVYKVAADLFYKFQAICSCYPGGIHIRGTNTRG
jgi:hypothetical protein